MTNGTVKRAKPRIHILSGYGGNEPDNLRVNAAPKSGEVIMSGMLISLDENGQWVKGCPAGKVPYFAFHDQADYDVQAANSLTGLSCLGKYRIQTAYVTVDGNTYGPNTPLMPDGAHPGYVKAGEVVSTTDDLIGYCTKDGLVDLFGQDSSATPDADGHVYALLIDTNFTPNRNA
jgi:hypothetical protein